MRYILIVVVALAGIVMPATPAEAATCQPGAPTQFDMAGTYESATMRVVVYPCGGISVAWENVYGGHAAAYGGIGRLAGNGIMAYGTMPDAMAGGFLDGSVYLGIKAAERGYVELVTYGPSPDPYNLPVRAVYRLRKVA